MILGLRPSKIGILLFIAAIVFIVLVCVHAVVYHSPEVAFIGPLPASYFWFAIMMVASVVTFWILGLYLTKGGNEK